MGGAILGAFDDIFTIRDIKIGKFIGLPLKYRLAFVVLFASVAA
jgi:hypothetical protein